MSSPNRPSPSSFATPYSAERKILLARRKLPPREEQEEQPAAKAPSPSGSDMDISETPDINGIFNDPEDSGTPEASEAPEASPSPSSSKSPQKPLNFFNLGPNGELLDGNAEAYKALGFGWVGADHPTRREWTEFAKEGFQYKKSYEEKPKEDPEYLEIIEKYYPNWRTEKRKPRSRSVSRERSPPDWLEE